MVTWCFFFDLKTGRLHSHTKIKIDRIVHMIYSHFFYGDGLKPIVEYIEQNKTEQNHVRTLTTKN